MKVVFENVYLPQDLAVDRVGKANTLSSVAATGMSAKHLAPTQPVCGWLGTVFATPNRHWILLSLATFPIICT